MMPEKKDLLIKLYVQGLMILNTINRLIEKNNAEEVYFFSKINVCLLKNLNILRSIYYKKPYDNEDEYNDSMIQEMYKNWHGDSNIVLQKLYASIYYFLKGVEKLKCADYDESYLNASEGYLEEAMKEYFLKKAEIQLKEK